METSTPNHPALAEPLNELALWHTRRHEPDVARAMLARAQRLLEQAPQVDPLAIARVLTSRGRVDELLGEDKEARQRYLQALDLYRSTGAQPIGVVLQESAVWNNLGALLHRKRRFREAEPMFLEALGRLEQAVGKDDVRLLPTLDNLASLYRSQGRADAGATARRAAEIRRLALEASRRPVQQICCP